MGDENVAEMDVVVVVSEMAVTIHSRLTRLMQLSLA